MKVCLNNGNLSVKNKKTLNNLILKIKRHIDLWSLNIFWKYEIITTHIDTFVLRYIFDSYEQL